MHRDDVEAIICHTILAVCALVAFAVTVSTFGG